MECITPFVVQKKTGNVTMGTIQTIAVPCGKCPACRKRRTSAWSFRLQQEEKRSISSQFLTLTYATEHLPITEMWYQNLNKRDIQLFFKSLRKLHPEGHQTLKYYAVGEYGSKTDRPHYHIILFNADIALIQKAWPKGQIHYGQVTGASIGYTLKYMSKKSKIPTSDGDDRLQEFALISKGLGDNYLTKAMVKWHLADPYKRAYCNLTDGKKVAMPRYYKEKLYQEDHRKTIALKQRQLKIVQENKARAKDPDYSRNLFEAHKQVFRKQELDNSKQQKL